MRTVCQAAGTKTSGPPMERTSKSLNGRRLSKAAKVGAQLDPTWEISSPFPSMADINKVCQARFQGRCLTRVDILDVFSNSFTKRVISSISSSVSPIAEKLSSVILPPIRAHALHSFDIPFPAHYPANTNHRHTTVPGPAL